MNKEDITIAFVSLERHVFLQQSIESVKDFPKLLIYDNGSTNYTSKLMLSAYSKKYKSSYIRNEKNEGLSKAWNQCIIKAKTEWVALCPDDVIFREDWFKDLNKILELRPWTKVVFGNNYDCIILHKSIIPVIGWLDENFKQYPSCEDYQLHLRLSKVLGYSPYCWPGDHIQGEERFKRLEIATEAAKNYLREDNFTYWCTYQNSICKPLCYEIPHKKDGASYAKKNLNVETGEQYFLRNWEICNSNDFGALLNIDCQFYKLKKEGKWANTFYPEIIEMYEKRVYNGI